MNGLKKLFAFLTVFLAASGAFAQNNSLPRTRNETDVLYYLDDAVSRHDRYRTDPEHETRVGEPDDETRVEFTLNGKVSYLVAGACDANCKDVDLEAFDAEGFSVSIDNNSDDEPYLYIEPVETGTFLFADVEIVATYELFNVNRVKLENLIHKFFEPARLDLEIPDSLADPTDPENGFLCRSLPSTRRYGGSRTGRS